MEPQWSVDHEARADIAAIKEQIVALRKIINERDLRYEQRFRDQETAILKAENATEKRLEGLNEFRGQLSDQTSTLIPRIEAEQRINALSEKIELLKTWASEGYGRTSGRSDATAWVVAGVSMFFAIVAIIIEIVRTVPRT